MRGATLRMQRLPEDRRFQSTLPMRGATNTELLPGLGKGISIHAPHAGSDIDDDVTFLQLADFNPRSPCGERLCCFGTQRKPINFNPRSPCGERRYPFCILERFFDFNPRSPCGERQYLQLLIDLAHKFQSTLPMRGATRTTG